MSPLGTSLRSKILAIIACLLLCAPFLTGDGPVGPLLGSASAEGDEALFTVSYDDEKGDVVNITGGEPEGEPVQVLPGPPE